MKITFSIRYDTKWGESLFIILNDVKYPMQWNDGGMWTVTLETPASALKDYGYAVMKDGLTIRPEWGRHSAKATRFIEDSWIECPKGSVFLRRHQASKFDIPGFRGAGTAVPVFSLRTDDDFGIGDFKDLIPLVDWAAATGQTIIQLLPVTDTTRKGGWEDSYPYSPVSSFAFNPMYIRLQDLGIKEDAAFRRLRSELNALPEIDYPKVFAAKMSYVKKAFRERGGRDLSSKAYCKFIQDNACWLDEYARFCAERDSDDPQYHAWVQYHLDRQFCEVVDYARSKGISFKGDLPIGVSAESADARWHPELFNLDSSTGAPPDFFSKNGQNWGFPTYNWDTMENDGFAWWKRRLRKMSRYFDAFRIDHILGFFRIWEIPAECEYGIDGHFNPAIPYEAGEIEALGLPLEGLFRPDPRHKGAYQPRITPDTSSLEQWQRERFDALYNDFFFHRHDAFWARNARKKLPELLGATGMLACGEDLGMIPDCVPDVMAQERILSLEMACMEKGRPWPYLSVCATSSHDMEPLRLRKIVAGEGDPEPCIVKQILRDHLSSASMLAIFPIQDWVAISASLRREDAAAERINEPADPHHHWKYRFHRPLADLLADKEFVSDMRTLIEESGRNR